MRSTLQQAADHTLAHPEPPASPLWPHQGPNTWPVTPEQQRRNRELLVHAHHTPRTTAPLEEAG